MRLKYFEQALKKAGTSYKELEKDINDNGYLRRVIKAELLASDILTDIVYEFLFYDKNDGLFQKWNNILSKLEKQEVLADRGEVLDDYCIQTNGEFWVAECQLIDKRQRVKLFKLLAKDLGYEIKE